MAQRYRKVDPRFWADEKVQELGDPEALLLALYLFTGPATNQIGLYSLSPALVSEHCQIASPRVDEVFNEVLHTLGWHFHRLRRSGSGVLWIPRWWRYNQPANPKVLMGNLRDLHDVPVSPLDPRFFTNLRDLSRRKWKAYEDADASVTFVRTYRRSYPDRLRIVSQKYNNGNDLGGVDTYSQPKRQGTGAGNRSRKQEQEKEEPSMEHSIKNEAFELAYAERIVMLKSGGHLDGKASAKAEGYLSAGDWDALEDFLGAVEESIPGGDDEDEDDEEDE